MGYNQQKPEKTLNRGVRLINSLLSDEINHVVFENRKRSCRHRHLIDARDKFLLHRVYYKTKVERKNYPDTFAELSAEVWLSIAQIQKIIQSKADVLLEIKKRQPTLSDLKKQWPFFSW